MAHGLSWDENYGADGVRSGANIFFSATSGKLVTFRYTLETHVLGVVVADPPLAGIGAQRAYWLDADTLAWPQSLLGGVDAADLSWTLEHSADAALAVADGAVTGGDDPATLEYDPSASAPACNDVPALAGYVALRPAGLDRGAIASLVAERGRPARRRDAHRPPACSCPVCSTTCTRRARHPPHSAPRSTLSGPRSRCGRRPRSRCRSTLGRRRDRRPAGAPRR